MATSKKHDDMTAMALALKEMQETTKKFNDMMAAFEKKNALIDTSLKESTVCDYHDDYGSSYEFEAHNIKSKLSKRTQAANGKPTDNTADDNHQPSPIKQRNDELLEDLKQTSVVNGKSKFSQRIGFPGRNTFNLVLRQFIVNEVIYSDEDLAKACVKEVVESNEFVPKRLMKELQEHFKNGARYESSYISMPIIRQEIKSILQKEYDLGDVPKNLRKTKSKALLPTPPSKAPENSKAMLLAQDNDFLLSNWRKIVVLKEKIRALEPNTDDNELESLQSELQQTKQRSYWPCQEFSNVVLKAFHIDSFNKVSPAGLLNAINWVACLLQGTTKTSLSRKSLRKETQGFITRMKDSDNFVFKEEMLDKLHIAQYLNSIYTPTEFVFPIEKEKKPCQLIFLVEDEEEEEGETAQQEEEEKEKAQEEDEEEDEEEEDDEEEDEEEEEDDEEEVVLNEEEQNMLRKHLEKKSRQKLRAQTNRSLGKKKKTLKRKAVVVLPAPPPPHQPSPPSSPAPSPPPQKRRQRSKRMKSSSSKLLNCVVYDGMESS